MQINQIKRKNPNRRSVLVGRGGKRGKTSGRGGKGQTARAGHKVRPEWRDIIKRLPKQRGYSFQSLSKVKSPITPLNLNVLEKAFKAGSVVNPSTLVQFGVVSLYKGRNRSIKILGGGEVSKKLIVVGCSVSASAKAKIEKAGGVVK